MIIIPYEIVLMFPTSKFLNKSGARAALVYLVNRLIMYIQLENNNQPIKYVRESEGLYIKDNNMTTEEYNTQP
jgi:hypothetical protein